MIKFIDGIYLILLSNWNDHQLLYNCYDPSKCLLDNWYHAECNLPFEISTDDPAYVWQFFAEVSISGYLPYTQAGCQSGYGGASVFWYKLSENNCEVNVRISPSEVWPQKTSSNTNNTEADVSVTLTKPAPSGGCTINLKVEPVEKSGGHSHHDSNRLKGSVTPNSILFSEGEIGTKKSKYKSSEISGEEKIEAEINGEVKSETPVKVRVPGFLELGEGDGYVLIGSTSSHPENHFGTEKTLFSLMDLADTYLENVKGTLMINDISLTDGGLFDIRANWVPPHKSHRIGKNIDVDDVMAEGKKVTKTSLKKTIEMLGIKATILNEGNHFHLTFP